MLYFMYLAILQKQMSLCLHVYLYFVEDIRFISLEDSLQKTVYNQGIQGVTVYNQGIQGVTVYNQGIQGVTVYNLVSKV